MYAVVLDLPAFRYNPPTRQCEGRALKKRGNKLEKKLKDYCIKHWAWSIYTYISYRFISWSVQQPFSSIAVRQNLTPRKIFPQLVIPCQIHHFHLAQEIWRPLEITVTLHAINCKKFMCGVWLYANKAELWKYVRNLVLLTTVSLYDMYVNSAAIRMRKAKGLESPLLAFSLAWVVQEFSAL